jgi:molybdopterin/thiamine biosynthesis adenylyltransferase
VRDHGDLAVVQDCEDSNTFAVLTAPGPRNSAYTDAEIVILTRDSTGSDTPKINAFANEPTGLRKITVTVRPEKFDIFDRVKGVFESDILREKCVLTIGCGSGGSYILREMVRSGVGRFILIDHDRLEIGNVCRHELGLADVGRLKVNAMRDYLLERNPDATVEVHQFRLDGSTLSRLLQIVESAKPGVIVCGTDNRESRLLVNRVSMLTGAVTLYGGVRRRAYAGDVLRVIPHLTPCYQCFVQSLPAVATDQEISSTEGARQVAYSDRPVVPEPGLSSDIAPTAIMMAKLALVELMEGTPSAVFDSLREDLVSPLYFWLNRREASTPYAEWPPLFDRVDGPGILRWMGQWLERDPRCAVCGEMSNAVPDEDLALFRTKA